MDLSPYIRELILLNECIILPGFGGFETEYQPARHDSANGIMLPPSKKVIFKPEYISGGDILKNHLETQLKIKPEFADKLITDFISGIKSKLLAGEAVKLGGIGTFRSDSEGEYLFIPVEDENYLAESFGLEPLRVKTPHPEFQKTGTKKPEININRRNSTLSFVIAGVIVILVLLTATIVISSHYNLYLFNIGDRKANNDMIILGGDSKKDSNLVRLSNKIEESAQIKNALSYSESKSDTTNTVLKKNYNNGRHLIIAGSFKSMSNAQDLQKKLINEGFKTQIVEVGGYYRVCVGIFNDKSSAINELHRIRQQMTRSVWLLSVDK